MNNLKMNYVLHIVVILSGLCRAIPLGDVDPDVNRNVSQLITSKGYPFEQHFVETTDGYILGIHRIPPKQKAGYDSEEMNVTRIPVYIHEHPAGTSIKNMLHYSQSVLSNRFQMFDYGSPKANMDYYNQTTPPLYDVSKMKNNVTLYTGGNDILADPMDVQYLLKTLPEIYRHIHISNYEHLDFIWAMNANRQVYDDIINTILYHENKMH